MKKSKPKLRIVKPKKRKIVKIEIASQEQTKFVANITDEFLDKVLGFPGALVTDESGLSHFEDFFDLKENKREKGIKKVINKCKKVYGVDITDIYHKRFPEIMKYIEEHRTK